MVRRTLVLLSLVLVFATVVEAQTRPQRPTRPIMSREGRWDFSLQTRYATSQEFTKDGGSSVKLQDDLGWGFGFGYHFNERFNLGLAFGWRSVPYEAVAVDAAGEDAAQRYSGKLSTSSIGLTGDWNILPGRVTPYVNGSLAWMLIDTNILAGWSSGCWWDPWWGYVCGNVPTTYGKNTGAYTLGVGCRFEVTEAFFIRAGYEHGWISEGAAEGANMLRVDLGLMN